MAKRTGGQVNDETRRVETGRMPQGSAEDPCVIKDRSHLNPLNWRKR